LYSVSATFINVPIIVFRSDISAGNSLSVPQYSAVPFCGTDLWFFLCDMLFTEINAAQLLLLFHTFNCQQICVDNDVIRRLTEYSRSVRCTIFGLTSGRQPHSLPADKKTKCLEYGYQYPQRVPYILRTA